MVGKRPRPSMKRTISTMGLSTDLDLDGDIHLHHHRPQSSGRDGGLFHAAVERQWLETQTPSWGGEGATGHIEVGNGGGGGVGGRRAQKPRTCISPEGMCGHGNVSDPFSPEFLPVATASFLRACGLCRRPLGPGKDTFIYRGEIAFCSLECRQQQIAIEERKEKCSFVSIKNDPSRATARPKSSRRCKTAAA